jgi:uncharacterized damage-inducible protein DinB
VGDAKETLHGYLRRQRAALRVKLDGLDEYDARRPLVPTGTNLLGLVRHVAGVQLEYFGVVFGRPADRWFPWQDDDQPDADTWVPADVPRADVLRFADLSDQHADATITALPLDAPGDVPWWGGRRSTTLHTVLTHMAVEAARHAGHADLLRELVDGSTAGGSPVVGAPTPTAAEWAARRDRIEAAARAAGRV